MTNSSSLTYWISIGVCTIALVALVVITWRHFRGLDSTKLRAVDYALSVFFTSIAVIVTIDLFFVAQQFDKYITQTVPRDEAQDQCEKDIIHILRIWAQSRKDLDVAQRTREESLLPFYTQFYYGEKIDQITAMEVINRTKQLEAARDAADRVYEENPIPKCNIEIDNG